MGSGVAGAIKAKGGNEIEKEAMSKGPIPTGEAIVTTAGNLKAKYVIHAVVMGQDLRTDEKYIKDATWNSLKRAEELKLSSIAFPALGTGVGGFPVDRCAEMMINTVREYLRTTELIKELTFVLFDEKTFYTFLEKWDEVEYNIKDLEFIDNFIHFNAFYRHTIMDWLLRQYDQGEEGDRIAFCAEIYSLFIAMTEDIGKIIIAMMNKKYYPKYSLFYYYCNDIKSKDWQKVYDILKTDSLDERLANINLPKMAELKDTPNYERLLKKEDHFQDQIDKALKCLSAILVLRRPKLFREAYNSIKHGLKFIVWKDTHEFFFINKSINLNESEILAKGSKLKLTKENSKMILEEAKNVELSFGVILGWYYLLKFKVNDETINNIFNGCLACFDRDFSFNGGFK